ncbi:MAG: ADP-ribosylglycohydrolase family protein [Chloroflexota bacterium]|nr:ADP-ribosylglycohydrolase family protein [Chloroflexota bacterium]
MSTNHRKLTLAKFIGTLVGAAIGDSLGAGREGFSGFQEVREIGPRYTDDTAMMMGIAESLIHRHGFDGEHMAQTFIKNYEREPWRGYGSGPPRIFNLIKQGISWDKAAEEIYLGGSFGNGAAMRIAPVALFYYEDQEKLREIAYKSSKITHTNSLAIEGATLEAYAIALALKEEPQFLDKLKEFTECELYKKKLENIERLLDKKEDRKKIVKELGNGVEAFNSVPTAIYSFLANSSFTEAIVYAVSLGGDTDTIGAMTGAIAGAWWGATEIPFAWQRRLENREFTEALARDLWKIKEE